VPPGERCSSGGAGGLIGVMMQDVALAPEFRARELIELVAS
jgi:hypothetical protein